MPIEGIVVTDAELDHTVGHHAAARGSAASALRHRARCIRMLEEDSRILPVTRAFAEVNVTDDGARDSRSRSAMATAADSGLEVDELSRLPAGPPRFARDDMPGHTWD